MIFFHECERYLDSLGKEDGGLLETVERKINDLSHRKELSPSKMLKVYDRANGILILKLRGQGRNSRIIIQEYIETNESEEFKIYFLRDYISQSDYEPRWRMRIQPEVEKGNYLSMFPLAETELEVARKAYLEQKNTEKVTLNPLPDDMMEWLLDFSVDQDFCIYETRDWVSFSEKEMTGYEGDFYKVIRAIYAPELPVGINKHMILHEDRTIRQLYDDQVYIIYEETGLETGRGGNKVILLHIGGLMLHSDRFLEDRERVKSFAPLQEVQEGKYSFDLISRAAYRAYPESALRERKRWQELQNRSAKSNLALSPEQILLLQDYRFPKFINGQAGSGKSEMLYYLFAEICFRKEANGYLGRPVFLTENEELLERALYDTIDKLKNNHAYREYDLDDEQLNQYFAPFQQFITEKLIDDPEKYPSSKAVNFSRFKQLYESCALPDHTKKKYPAEIAWFIIYTFIKGYEADKEELTPEEFDQLPRRDKNIVDKETYEGVFEEVWKPFYKRYQEQQGYWDRIDLVKEVLNKYEDIPLEWKFTAILCDEAQDFTRVELQLLIKLSKYLDYDLSFLGQFPVTFAGDPFQTVNPTGFSLEKLKRLFTGELERYSNLKLEHDFTEELHYNYRSGEPIVNLANLIQYVRYRYLDTSDLRNPQQAKQLGDFDLPEFFSLERWDADLKTKLKYGVFIIPCNDGEEEEFVAQIPQLKDSEFNIKTAARSKGSEYPVVVLFKFGDELLKEFSPHFFKRLLDQETDYKQLTAGQQFKLSFYFNKLYVAITRAQEKLIIIDSTEALTHFWQPLREHPSMKAMEWEGVEPDRAFLEGNVSDLGDPDYATARRNADSDKEAGILYSDPKKMEDAARLYRQLGPEHENKAIFCEAKALEFREEFGKAGQKFESIIDWENASRCYWLGKEWESLLRVNKTFLTKPKFQIRSYVAEIMLGRPIDVIPLQQHRANIANAFKDRELRGRLDWAEAFYTKLAEEILQATKENTSSTQEEIAGILASFRVEYPPLHNIIAALYFRAGNFRKAVEHWERIEAYDTPKYAEAKFQVCTGLSEKIFYMEKFSTPEELLQFYEEHKDQHESLSELGAEIIQRTYWQTGNFIRALAINQQYGLPWAPLFRAVKNKELPEFRNFISFLEDHLKNLPPGERRKYLTPETLESILETIKEERIIRKYLSHRRSIGKRDLYQELREKSSFLDVVVSLVNLIGLSELQPNNISSDYFDLVLFGGYLLRKKKARTEEDYLLYACALERTQAVLKDILPAFDSEKDFMLKDTILEDPLRMQLEKRWIKIKFKLERREIKVPKDSDLTSDQKEQIMTIFRETIRNAQGRYLQFEHPKYSFKELADLPDLPNFDTLLKDMQEPAVTAQSAPPKDETPIFTAGSLDISDPLPSKTVTADVKANGSPKPKKAPAKVVKELEEMPIMPEQLNPDNQALQHQINLLEEKIKSLEKQLDLKDQLLVEKERTLKSMEMAIAHLKQ